MEERHSWLPPGLESPGLEPDDRASQRGDRRRDERRPEPRSEEKAGDRAEPTVTRAGDESKYRKLRGSRDWKPLDEGDSGDEGESDAKDSARGREPAKVAAASDDDADNGDRDRAARRERGEASGNGDGPSETDAMGQDKRRQVIGQRYGASRARQFLYYGIFLAFLVVLYIGGQAAVSHFDKAPKHDKAQAPWAQKGAPDNPLGGFQPRKSGQKGPTRFQ